MVAPLPGPRPILGRPLPDVPARARGNSLHVVVVATVTTRDSRVVAPQLRVVGACQCMGRTLVPPRPIAPEQPPARAVLSSTRVSSRAVVVAAGTRSVGALRPPSPVPWAKAWARCWRWRWWSFISRSGIAIVRDTRGPIRGRVKRTRRRPLQVHSFHFHKDVGLSRMLNLTSGDERRGGSHDRRDEEDEGRGTQVQGQCPRARCA